MKTIPLTKGKVAMVSDEDYEWLSSKFKGVSFFKRTQSWQVRVGREWIGYFKDEKDAAVAYNSTAAKRYGEFALLNDVCEYT